MTGTTTTLTPGSGLAASYGALSGGMPPPSLTTTPPASYVPGHPPAFPAPGGIPQDRLITSDEVIDAVKRHAGSRPYEMSAGARQEFNKLREYMETVTNTIREDDKIGSEEKQRKLQAATQFYNRTLLYLGISDDAAAVAIKADDEKRKARGLAPGAWQNAQSAFQARNGFYQRVYEEAHKDMDAKNALTLLAKETRGGGWLSMVYDAKKGKEEGTLGGIQWGGIVGAVGGFFLLRNVLGGSLGGLGKLLLGLGGALGGALAGNMIGDWVKRRNNPPEPTVSPGLGLHVAQGPSPAVETALGAAPSETKDVVALAEEERKRAAGTGITGGSHTTTTATPVALTTKPKEEGTSATL